MEPDCTEDHSCQRKEYGVKARLGRETAHLRKGFKPCRPTVVTCAPENFRQVVESFTSKESSGNKRGSAEPSIVKGNAVSDSLSGLGITDPQRESVTEVCVKDSELSKLHSDPRCPRLTKLVLQGNYELRTIPSSFFGNMLALQVIKLSKTCIKMLPDSLFALVFLRELHLIDSEFLVVLPPTVGELRRLEVLDLKGTQIVELPKEIEKLTELRLLKVSFYAYMKRAKKLMIPGGVISALHKLRELRIVVNPDDERWNASVEDVVKEVGGLRELEKLEFYFPKVELLRHLNWSYPPFSRFRITAGHHVKCIVSRFLFDVECELKRWGRGLAYVYGDGIPEEVKEVLKYAAAFHLDRHLTAQKLSEFGLENMKRLKCCILGECNEIRAIGSGEDILETAETGKKRVGLGSLEYLNIYYMKNLTSIWEGSVHQGCFALLRCLILRTCPQMTTVFTIDLLGVLNNLQELTVEDCPAVTCLVSWDNRANQKSSSYRLDYFLPKLKKISLHFMTELISLSSGLQIAPSLEYMCIYNCPKLRNLSIGEVPRKTVKAIKGERDWWEALKWVTGWQEYSNARFVPIDSPIDIIEDGANVVHSEPCL